MGVVEVLVVFFQVMFDDVYFVMFIGGCQCKDCVFKVVEYMGLVLYDYFKGFVVGVVIGFVGCYGCFLGDGC